METAILNEIASRLARVEGKVDILIDPLQVITRTQISKAIGRRTYEYGVKTGWLHPMKKPGRNATVRIKMHEYESFLKHLTQ